MQNQFYLTLPATASSEDAMAIQRELQTVPGVEQVGADAVRSRGLDPHSLSIWFNVATAVFSAAGVALPFFLRIKDLIKKKKLAAVTLKLPDGTEIALENITAEEVEQVLKKVQDSQT